MKKFDFNDLILDYDTDEQLEYEAKTENIGSVVKHGQRKLGIMLIQSLLAMYEKYETKEFAVFYVGAAPGNNIAIIAKLFKGPKWYLYDPATFEIKKSNNITIHNRLFEDKDVAFMAETAKTRNVLFISDIRRDINPGASTEEKEEANNAVWEDMLLQQRWFLESKADMGMLKFRLPWPDGKFNDTVPYMNGTVYYSVWGGRSTSETRLLVKNGARQIDWDLKLYDDTLHWHNSLRRTQFKYEPVFPGEYDVNGITNDWDSSAEVFTMKLASSEWFGFKTQLKQSSELLSRELDKHLSDENSKRTLAYIRANPKQTTVVRIPDTKNLDSSQRSRIIFPGNHRPELDVNYTEDMLSSATSFAQAKSISYAINSRITFYKDEVDKRYHMIVLFSGLGSHVFSAMENPKISKITAHEQDETSSSILKNNIKMYKDSSKVSDINIVKGDFIIEKHNLKGSCVFINPTWNVDDWISPESLSESGLQYVRSGLMIYEFSLEEYILKLLSLKLNGPKLVVVKVPPKYEISRLVLDYYRVEQYDMVGMRIYFIKKFARGYIESKPSQLYYGMINLSDISCAIPTTAFTESSYDIQFHCQSTTNPVINNKVLIPITNNTSDMVLIEQIMNKLERHKRLLGVVRGTFIPTHLDRLMEFYYHKRKGLDKESSDMYEHWAKNNAVKGMWNWFNNSDKIESNLRLAEISGVVTYIITEPMFEANSIHINYIHNDPISGNTRFNILRLMILRAIFGVPSGNIEDIGINMGDVVDINYSNRIGEFYKNLYDLPRNYLPQTTKELSEMGSAIQNWIKINLTDAVLDPTFIEHMPRLYGMDMSIFPNTALDNIKSLRGRIMTLSPMSLFTSIFGEMDWIHVPIEEVQEIDESLFARARSNPDILKRLTAFIKSKGGENAEAMIRVLNNYKLGDIETLTKMKALAKVTSKLQGNREASRIDDIQYELDYIKENVDQLVYLDLGSSEGKITSAMVEALELPRENAVAVDIVQQEDDNDAYQFFKSEPNSIPSDDGVFNLVTMFMSAHHFGEIDKMMEELDRITVYGAFVIMREHDLNYDGQEIFLDIVHAVYETVLGDESTPERFMESYNESQFAYYRSTKDWISILSKYGFSLVEGIKPHGPMSNGKYIKDRFDTVYMLFQKN